MKQNHNRSNQWCEAPQRCNGGAEAFKILPQYFPQTPLIGSSPSLSSPSFPTYLHAVRRGESVNVHRSGLANAVAAVHGLHVRVRVLEGGHEQGRGREGRTCFGSPTVSEHTQRVKEAHGFSISDRIHNNSIENIRRGGP